MRDVKTKKPNSEFSLGQRTATGLFSYCHSCRREDNFTRKYGITLLDYANLLQAQEGRCAICHRQPEEILRKAEKYRRLVVDHNHQTGKVRHLLCGECNLALDFFKENSILLTEAIQYLKKHS